MDNGKVESITRKITVLGIVQGVGFRPLVYRFAKKHSIMGTVRNMGGLVEIITQSTQQDLDEFLHELKTNKNSGYEIINIKIQDIEEQKFLKKQILLS